MREAAQISALWSECSIFQRCLCSYRDGVMRRQLVSPDRFQVMLCAGNEMQGLWIISVCKHMGSHTLNYTR